MATTRNSFYCKKSIKSDPSVSLIIPVLIKSECFRLTTNFEKSETDELSANDTYDHYVTACIAANNTVPVKFEQLKKVCLCWELAEFLSKHVIQYFENDCKTFCTH